MAIENLVILVVLVVSFVGSYRVAHKTLWYQVHKLFEIISTSSDTPQDKQFFEEIGGGSIDNQFLYTFYSRYTLLSKYHVGFVKVLFCTILSLSVVVVEIVLWKIKTFDEKNETSSFITSTIWPVDLSVLSMCLILLVPYCVVLMVLNKFYQKTISTEVLTILTGTVIICWLGSLHFLRVGPFYYTSNLLTKLALTGTTVMAALSGVVSVSTPYQMIAKFWQNRNWILMKNIANVSVTSTIFSTSEYVTTEKIKDYEQSILENIRILKKLRQIPSNGTDTIMKQQLVEKIAWCKIELENLKNTHKKSRSVKFVTKMLEIAFFFFCIFRLVVVFGVNVPKQMKYRLGHPEDVHFENFGKENEADPLAVTLANILDIFLFTFDHQQDLDALSKQISLIFSLSMFACSLSTVSSTITNLLGFLPLKFKLLAISVIALDGKKSDLPTSSKDYESSMRKEPSTIKNLVFVELLGVYILATVLLIRSNLPYDVSANLNIFLGSKFSVPSVNIDIWFDKVFACSAILTVIGIAYTTFKKMSVARHSTSMKKT